MCKAARSIELYDNSLAFLLISPFNALAYIFSGCRIYNAVDCNDQHILFALRKSGTERERDRKIKRASVLFNMLELYHKAIKHCII